MKQKHFWLKLVGVALLLHIVLILLSILEVAIYSYLVNPGQSEAYYEAHAGKSAPWISYIFGSIFVFLLVKRFVRRFTQQQLLYALLLPLLYGLTDYLILVAAGAGAAALGTPFIIGKVVKIVAALMAYAIYRSKKDE